MLYVGRKLDRLQQIDKQLHLVGVQCTVEIPDGLADTPKDPLAEAAVPVTLGFYHQNTRTKFDLVLSITASTISYSRFVFFYGPVQEHDILDAANLSLTAKFHPIRRLTTAILEVIDSRAPQEKK